MRPHTRLLGATLALCCLVQAPGFAQQRMLAMAQQPTSDADRARARALLPPDPTRQLEYVRPQDTDPRISQFLQDHVVIQYPARPSNGQLVVFLPGTFGRPVAYQLFLDTAARLGARAIGLEYVDAVSTGGPSTLSRICGRGEDANCAGSIRAARSFGGQGADDNPVAKPDAIVPRLVALLTTLDRQHPQAGWAQFLRGGQPDWSRIVLAGHSQGAGMAAFLAKTYPVARVVLISGGADGNFRTRTPAAWVQGPSATPADRWYALACASEPQVQAMLAGLTVLGVAGPPTDWSGAGAMQGSHIALVDQEPRAGGKHESTAADISTPLTPDGGPAYGAVWRFLLGTR